MNYLNETKTAYINLPSKFYQISEILSNNDEASFVEIYDLLVSNISGLKRDEAMYWAEQHRVFRMNIVMDDGTICTPTGRVLGL